MIYLTDFESSLVQLMLGIGLVLMLPAVLDKESRLHRSLLFGLVGVLAIRYVWWRATQTLAPFGLTWDCLASWSFFAIEAASIVSSLSAFTILTRTKNRTAEADRLEGWWKPARAPKAVVLIATYNEERDVLERTLNGASGLDYDNFEVLVLDDGRRPWLAELSAEKGARYLTRPDNFHAKAGNINHALRLLAEEDEPPEFVAVRLALERTFGRWQLTRDGVGVTATELIDLLAARLALRGVEVRTGTPVTAIARTALPDSATIAPPVTETS